MHSADIVQGDSGQCRLSTKSMGIVQSEWAPWTLSRVSMDSVQTFHLFQDQCPESPWALSTETMDSVDILQTGCLLLLHLLIARCDIGVQLSVRSFVRPSVPPSTIYVKVFTL